MLSIGSPASWARYSRSMLTRKPDSVLPEPVGAATSVSEPAAMCGHAARCGSVGPSGNRRRNHVPTAGWNPSTASGTALAPSTSWRAAGMRVLAMATILASQVGQV
jgi:hypothetical protein